MDIFKDEVAKLNAKYDKIVEDGKKRIAELRKQGKTDEEIQSIVTQEGLVKIDETFPKSEVEATYIWQLDPTTDEHCADCLENSKKAPMTYDEWLEVTLPGLGKTACDNLCRCSLVAANILKK